MADKISRRKVLASLAKGSVVATGVASSILSAEIRAASSSEEPKLFDIHQHLESSDSTFSDFEIAALIDKDFNVRSRSMDENGIEKSVIFPSTQYRRTNGIESTKKINDLVAAYVSKHSDRFPVGLGIVEVTHGDDSLRELDRIAKELKLRGIVWHHAHSGIPIDHPFMRPILKSMQELRLIPFIHVHWKPYESLWMLEVLAEEFPTVSFVALAALAAQEDHQQAVQIGIRRKNILFDTGPVLWERERGLESFVKRIGSDRLLFGSDLYAMQPSYRRPTTTLEIIRNSLLKENEKAAILRQNVIRLFGLSESGVR